MSKGEDKIAKLLNKSNLVYEREYMFADCRSSKHSPMRFDFAIFDSGNHIICLIEYDGEQHFEQISKFQKNRKDFLKTQGHDRQKNSYALAHGIPLYRIPYWEIDNINTTRDLIKQRYLVQDRFHNDNLTPPQ